MRDEPAALLFTAYMIPVNLMDNVLRPLVMGRGRRLFTDDAQRSALTLVKSVTTTTGVMIATYHPNPDPSGPTEGRR